MNGTLFDLRPLAPAQRHQQAINCFRVLGEGQHFELLDHEEPHSLLMHLHAQHPQAFNWQVLQAEPGYWRIRVDRVAQGLGMAPAPLPRRSSGCMDCGCS